MNTEKGNFYEQLAHIRNLTAQLEKTFADDAVVQSRCAYIQNQIQWVENGITLAPNTTIISLVGGTGCGKSALFNALTGTDFADSGVRRPTTEEPSAALYTANFEEKTQLEELCKTLEIRAERQIVLPGLGSGTQAPKSSRILLDLPDHDSVVPANALHSQRIVPVSDVLVWVVNPAKYADPGAYLPQLAKRKMATLVVVNHSDTVNRAELKAVVRDLRALLDRNGLQSVVVLVTCAITGEGVDALQAELDGREQAAIKRGTWQAQIDEISALLAQMGGKYLFSEKALMQATNRVLAAGSASSPNKIALQAIRGSYVNEVTANLPDVWRYLVADKPAGADRAGREIGKLYQEFMEDHNIAQRKQCTGRRIKDALICIAALFLTLFFPILSAITSAGNFFGYRLVTTGLIGNGLAVSLSILAVWLWLLILVRFSKRRSDDLQVSELRQKLESQVKVCLEKLWEFPVRQSLDLYQQLGSLENNSDKS